jgi:hypothetical protein
LPFTSQLKRKLTFAWSIYAPDINKDRQILTGISSEIYFSKVEIKILISS